jgi:hypothetical protein
MNIVVVGRGNVGGGLTERKADHDVIGLGCRRRGVADLGSRARGTRFGTMCRPVPIVGDGPLGGRTALTPLR